MKRLLALLAVFVLAWPGAASAESVDQVVTGLRSNPVYQSPGVDLVDADELRDTLSGTPRLYVAALSAAAATSADEASKRAVEIGRALGDKGSVVLVITANRHLGIGAGSGAASQGVRANQALREQLAAHTRQPFDKAHVTTFVEELDERLRDQVDVAAKRTSSSSGDSGGGGGKVLLVLLVLAAVGLFLFTRSRKQKAAKVEEGLRADVEQLYHRLGSEVSFLNPGDNAVAQQAMADAAERYNACGAALANADSPGEFAAARRTAVEGLTAARVARKELGLDPGPEIPLPQGSGERLTQEEQLTLGDQTVYGSPQYAPGRQHYYEGGMVNGQVVRGGWYSAPFWEPFLLGSLLSGGFGGFGGGGGFERGYEAGHEAGEHEAGGGDWSGGGSWGGGESGGDSGGGDWGGGDAGGGGDSGGGDW